MLEQPTLDIYVLRGIAGLIRILDEREGPVSPAVKSHVLGVRGQLALVCDKLQASETDRGSEIDVDRLDRWLLTGLATFAEFLEARAYNDQIGAKFDLPIRAVIEKLQTLQKQISEKLP
jgi:hypothetical protein